MRNEDFERLYADHARPLLKFLIYRTGDHTLAEDLAASTFERVLTARRGFDRRRASEKTWLYAIALNQLRDHARRTAVANQVLDRAPAAVEVPAVGGEFEAIERRDEVARALATLSAVEREAVALRYGADLTMPEIARLTRQKLSTIEGRIERAMRKLKRGLESASP